MFKFNMFPFINNKIKFNINKKITFFLLNNKNKVSLKKLNFFKIIPLLILICFIF